MATTKNGIYYPDNYDEVADVPNDMKKMAESIDAGLSGKVDKVDGKDLSTNDFTNAYKNKLDGLSNYDDSGIKQDIVKQNDLISRLKGNQINLTAEGTSINVKDASDLPAVIEVSGGVRQNGEPTPDSPVEVETVGDNVNLYPYEKILFSSSRSTIAWCYINGLDTAYGTDVLDKTEYKITLKPGTYNINLKSDDKNLVNFQLVTKGDTAEKIISTDNSSFTLNDETTVTLRYRVNNPSLGLKIDSIKIEPGSVATSYSPYGMGSVEINKVNKNLYLKSNVLRNGLWFMGGNIGNNGSGWFVIIPIKGDQTYTVSRKYAGTSTNKLSFYIGTSKEYPKNGVSFVNPWTKVEGTSHKLQALKEANYLFLGLAAVSSFDVTEEIKKMAVEELMVEVSDEKSKYTEGQQEVYNLPIQQPMLSKDKDTFVKEDGNWFEVHGWENYVITGNESWTQLNNIEGWYEAFCAEITGETNSGRSVVANIKSNMFLAKSLDDMFVQKISGIGARANGNIVIAFDSSYGITSINSFKAKLQELYNAGTPVEIWYKLTTPTKLPCTPEQVEVLEELYNNETYRPVTNIFTQEDLANLKLNYVADTKLYIDNKINTMQANIDTINQLLSTTGTSALLLNNMKTDLESEVM